jgi:colanic acid biosynthesis glycosyl transferase WcaI
LKFKFEINRSSKNAPKTNTNSFFLFTMHILFLAPHYSPDLGPSAPLFSMLSEGLVNLGHTVSVVTTVPHYPTGRVSSEFKGFRNNHSIENGVDVTRIALPSVNRSNLRFRFLQFIFYQIRSTFNILTKKYEVLLVANPSLWVWLPFFWSVKVRRKPAVYSIYDVYPDVGISLGIFRDPIVIKAVRFLECFCLNNSEVIHILADSFRQSLVALGVYDAKMSKVYVWVDTDLIRPLPRNNSFALENNLVDLFTVLYAGNIGLSQGLEHVLASAQLLSDHRDIQFVFVGDGAGREQLVSEVKQRQLANVTFLPFQPRQRLPEVLASADVSLVSLKRGIGAGSLPSKLFSILASGRPIIASVDEGCETWKLVEKARAGICTPPENPPELARAILALKDDQELRERLGKNGRLWAELNHSPQSAAEHFEELLYRAITKKGRSLLVSPENKS